MALLDDVKSELAAIDADIPLAKRAQVTSMIRFAGGLRATEQGSVIMQVQLDNLDAATWLQTNIRELFDKEATISTVSRSTPKGAIQNFYILRVEQGATMLALQTGIYDRRRQRVRGLPADIVNGNIAKVKAAWRGAFLAHGALSDPGKTSYLEVICPCTEAAMALSGIAHRLGINAKPRQLRSSQRVTLKDPDSIERMLNLIGAPHSAREWTGKRSDGEARGKANRLANFDDANMRRSAKAAAEACDKVRHAFEVFEAEGIEIPDNLRTAGELRLAHGDASLEELGRLADPPISKDAIAGRIRRLLQLASKSERAAAK